MVIYHKTIFDHITSYHHVVAFMFFFRVLLTIQVAFLGMPDACKIINMQRNANYAMVYIPRAVYWDVYNLSGKLLIASKRGKQILRHVLIANAYHVIAVRHNR